MAHFAEVDESNKVIRVIVVNNDMLLENGVESEGKGIAFCKSLYGDNTKWIQVSYNAASNGFRKHYPGTGWTYDADFDGFYSPQPYPSWKLNYETFIWEAPIPKPANQEGFEWKWAELSQEWIAKPID